MNIDKEGVFYGYEIGANVLPFSLANATTNFSDDDAVIEFKLHNDTRGVIRLHPERTTRFYVDKHGPALNTRTC